jgi:hypothetical protein
MQMAITDSRLSGRLTGLVLFALLCGCATRLPTVPHDEGDISVRIVEGSFHRQRELQAGSPEARRFDKWLEENAGGWRGYYATAPKDGIFVSTRLGLLQFSRSMVIAVNQEGQYAKAVSEDIYSFLQGAAL